jgi:AraC-like DNA-binding protein
MAGDQLSEVFDLVEVRGLVSGGFAARGDWVARFPIHYPLKLAAVVCGRVRLTADGLDRPIDLEPGDVAILNSRSWMVLEGGRGEDAPRELVVREGDPFVRFDDADCTGSSADVIVGGHVDLNTAGEALLVQALPPVGHVRAADASSLRGSLDRLIDEVTGNRMGSSFAIRQYGQLLLLDVLRAYVDQAELPSGWLRVLTDERLRPAVTLMHAEPGRGWRLDELAHASAMSRTSFAERFRTVAGVPPLTYLNSWRMKLAQRALRDGDTRVGALAAELGYSSESAFSNAFKREVGIAPLRYRSRIRDESSAARQSLPLMTPARQA